MSVKLSTQSRVASIGEPLHKENGMNSIDEKQLVEQMIRSTVAQKKLGWERAKEMYAQSPTDFNKRLYDHMETEYNKAVKSAIESGIVL